MLCLAVLDKYGLLEEGINSLQGKNLKIRCPFHGETVPSLLFNMETDNYYCFGCAKNGDIISFIQDMEGVTYLKAFAMSKTFENIEFRESKRLNEEQQKEEAVKSIKKAKEFFDQIPEVDWCSCHSKDMRYEYMLKERGFEREVLNKFGVRINVYATHPIVVPVHQVDRFKGYVRRTLDGNISNKYLYNKGFRKAYTLALQNSIGWESMPVLISEGMLDIMTAWQYGYRKVAALLGWCPSAYQIKKLKLLKCGTICALDNDEAGERGYQKLREHFPDIKRLRHYGSKDINEMPKQKFNNAVREVV